MYVMVKIFVDCVFCWNAKDKPHSRTQTYHVLFSMQEPLMLIILFRGANFPCISEAGLSCTFVVSSGAQVDVHVVARLLLVEFVHLLPVGAAVGLVDLFSIWSL